MSNFDWTDKLSVRWFILMPTGHEGPYSLRHLEDISSREKIAIDVKVWAEGLSRPVSLREAIERTTAPHEELPPPLPAEDIPPVPEFVPDVQDDDEEDDEISSPAAPQEKRPRRVPLPLLLFFLFLPVLAFFGYQWFREQEKITIARRPRMSPEAQKMITSTIRFEGWPKPLFFREFIAPDLSVIWLATSGFQNCEIEADFTSLEGKLLTLTEQKVSFSSRARLGGHVAELDKFVFREGNRIIRGLYEMKIRATQCRWDSLAARMGNRFEGPAPTYEATTRVVLFEKGAEEFNLLLDELNRKKQETALKAQGERNLFWDDLQQKLQTLLAISLQIEQFLLDFIEADPKNTPARVKVMVDSYTRKFGNFLTNFVNANEAQFVELKKGELRDLTVKKNYEELIRLASKQVGLTSMRILEELMKFKKDPTKAQLTQIKKRTIADFAKLKENINEKIISVTEDRSATP